MDRPIWRILFYKVILQNITHTHTHTHTHTQIQTQTANTNNTQMFSYTHRTINKIFVHFLMILAVFAMAKKKMTHNFMQNKNQRTHKKHDIIPTYIKCPTNTKTRHIKKIYFICFVFVLFSFVRLFCV